MSFRWGQSAVSDELQAADAVNAIGTKAIPKLLRMLRAKDSPAWEWLAALLDRLSVVKMNHVPAPELNRRGRWGFEVLRGKARGAVPELAEIYERNLCASSRNETALALAAIGLDAQGAVPALIRGLSDKDPTTFQNTVLALRRIHGRPELVLPGLAKCLDDTNGLNRTAAAWALFESSGDGHLAAPALVPLLHDPDASVRNVAARILERIDPDAAAKAGVGQ